MPADVQYTAGNGRRYGRGWIWSTDEAIEGWKIIPKQPSPTQQINLPAADVLVESPPAVARRK
jgi:hypothetical protein